MLISRKADYAVRCVLILADQRGRLASTTEIASAVLVTDGFIAKVLQQLTRAGVIQSVRGTQGGYRMIRDPSEVTLLEVVEAIQGTVQINECVTDGLGCALSGVCVVHPVWQQIREEFEARLRSVNFAVLARQARDQVGPDARLFPILDDPVL